MELAQIAALITAVAGLVTALGALMHSQNNRAAIKASKAVPDPLPRWKRGVQKAANLEMQATRRGW